MISGVIAKLYCGPETRKLAIDEIASHPALEIGELVDGRLLPVTIDAHGNGQTEEITRWMISLEGVAVVDVVYVQFEDDEADHEREDQNRGRPRLPLTTET